MIGSVKIYKDLTIPYLKTGDFMSVVRGRGDRIAKGFTITEILVAVAIVSIMIMGIFTLYVGQEASYVHQQEILQLQQQMRVALNKIVKEIRMAGYDPQQANETTPNTFGIQTAAANSIYFTVDTDRDGVVDPDERYRVRVDSSKVEYSDDNGTTWQSLTWHSLVAPVEAVSLSFTYYDSDGTVTAVLQDIRVVRIALTERVKLSGAVSMYYSKTLSSRVELRNL